MVDILLVPLLSVIQVILSLIVWVVIADVIIGWLFVADILNPNGRFVIMLADSLSRITNVLLDPIRRNIPCMFGAIDMSPMALILIVFFFENVIGRILLRLKGLY